ncbi:hypothetical protein GJ496_008767 [Pomphorhynchus laevis]|nr:hypothetical protein GJ496_008767 [Pomphorhynchus laevis]
MVRKRNGYLIGAIKVNLRYVYICHTFGLLTRSHGSRNPTFRLSYQTVCVWNELPYYVIESGDKSLLQTVLNLTCSLVQQ